MDYNVVRIPGRKTYKTVHVELLLPDTVSWFLKSKQCKPQEKAISHRLINNQNPFNWSKQGAIYYTETEPATRCFAASTPRKKTNRTNRIV